MQKNAGKTFTPKPDVQEPTCARIVPCSRSGKVYTGSGCANCAGNLSRVIPDPYFTLLFLILHIKNRLKISNRGGYNWQCIPDAPGSFGQRKPVPMPWRGLRGQELQAITGVASATFCHPAGFIGGAETLEDAIRLAVLAIKA